MSVDGTITEQHIAEEAEAGHTVTLTIDSNLQKVTEEALKKNIKDIAMVAMDKNIMQRLELQL